MNAMNRVMQYIAHVRGMQFLENMYNCAIIMRNKHGRTGVELLVASNIAFLNGADAAVFVDGICSLDPAVASVKMGN